MILVTYEIRTHHHKTLRLNEHVCPLCQQKNELKLHINQKYIWAFFLLGPVAPSIKFGVLACSACKTNIPSKNWSPEIKAIYKFEKNLVKLPLRFWRGLIVVLCMLLALFFYLSKALAKNRMFANVEKYSQTIEPNDLFIVMDSLNEHGLDQNKIMKIQKIEGNKIYLVLYKDRVAWEKQSEVDKDDLDPEKFSKQVLVYSLSAIKKKQELVKIDQNGQEEKTPCGGINGIIK